MTEPLVAQVAGLATLIELERRVRRAASLAELRFIAVNETHGLVPYRQAALLEGGSAKRLRVTALSGVASPDRNAPYVVWLGGLARAIGRQEARALEPGTIEAVGNPTVNQAMMTTATEHDALRTHSLSTPRKPPDVKKYRATRPTASSTAVGSRPRRTRTIADVTYVKANGSTMTTVIMNSSERPSDV